MGCRPSRSSSKVRPINPRVSNESSERTAVAPQAPPVAPQAPPAVKSKSSSLDIGASEAPMSTDPPKQQDTRGDDVVRAISPDVVRMVPLDEHEALEKLLEDSKEDLAVATKLRAKADEEVEWMKQQLVIDRKLPREEQVALLKLELNKLQPYGAVELDDTASRFEETAKAQASLIDKLEEELKRAHTEVSTLKEKYEKKVKRVRVSSAKQKAESSLQMFELKEQLAQMRQDHALLEAQLRAARNAAAQAAAPPTPSRVPESVASDTEGDNEASGSSMLVVQLSEQISDLDAELEAAYRKIDELQVINTGGGATAGGNEGPTRPPDP